MFIETSAFAGVNIYNQLLIYCFIYLFVIISCITSINSKMINFIDKSIVDKTQSITLIR